MKSSFEMAIRTLKILEAQVQSDRWKVAADLINTFKIIAQELKHADATETMTGNMILRGLKIVRDEYQRLSMGLEALPPDSEEGTLGMMIAIDPEQDSDYNTAHEDLKESILGYFEEWRSEVIESAENIAKESLKHIVNEDVVMTLGKSKTVEAFLKKAVAAKRSFQVVVAECAPFCHGHEMAKCLAEAGIKTSIIPDSAIFTFLSKVTKVIIGTHSVMANGGLKAVSGAYILAEAAKYHNVPLIVLAAMFKYTPEYLVSHDQVAFNKCGSPESLIPCRRGNLVLNLDVMNPVFDYVPPELVTVLIAGENEGHSPSYVYHKLSTVCHKKDYLSID